MSSRTYSDAAFVDERREASEASFYQGLVTDSTSRKPVINTLLSKLRRMKRNVLASANIINATVDRIKGFRHKAMFLTFTYRPTVDPAPHHMSDFWGNYRKWCGRIGIPCRYTWVAELHQSGRVHYHAIIWMPKSVRMPYPDQWRVVGKPPYHGIGPRPHAAWWPHGHTNMKPARSPVGYLAKYSSKAVRQVDNQEHTFPRGLRIYGVGGLDAEDRQIRRFINLPAWLAERVGPTEPMKRIQGGGWINKFSLDHWPSPWKLGRVLTVGGRTFVHLEPALPEGTELCFA